MGDKQLGLPRVENTPPCPQMKQPLPENHIRVVLDFIPVEERLPVPCVSMFSDCVVILYFDRKDIAIAQYDHSDGVWEYEGCEVSYPIPGVTHWAEIPQVKE